MCLWLYSPFSFAMYAFTRSGTQERCSWYCVRVPMCQCIVSLSKNWVVSDVRHDLGGVMQLIASIHHHQPRPFLRRSHCDQHNGEQGGTWVKNKIWNSDYYSLTLQTLHNEGYSRHQALRVTRETARNFPRSVNCVFVTFVPSEISVKRNIFLYLLLLVIRPLTKLIKLNSIWQNWPPNIKSHTPLQ